MSKPYKIFRKKSIETAAQLIQNRRALMEYPYDGMGVGDTVVFEPYTKGSNATIRRAAIQAGEDLNRVYKTRVLKSGQLGVERLA